jgi:subtilisin family serine protease
MSYLFNHAGGYFTTYADTWQGVMAEMAADGKLYVECASNARMWREDSTGVANPPGTSNSAPWHPDYGDFDNFLFVGANLIDDNWATYSDCGPHVNIAAANTGGTPLYHLGGVDYNQAGTSFAAPMVSGAAGLVWSIDLSLTAVQVANFVLAGTDEPRTGSNFYTYFPNAKILNCAKPVLAALAQKNVGKVYPYIGFERVLDFVYWTIKNGQNRLVIKPSGSFKTDLKAYSTTDATVQVYLGEDLVYDGPEGYLDATATADGELKPIRLVALADGNLRDVTYTDILATTLTIAAESPAIPGSLFDRHGNSPALKDKSGNKPVLTDKNGNILYQ